MSKTLSIFVCHQSVAAGFVKYLTKPIDVDLFLEAIDDVLENGPR